uniref:Adipocyte plasma membrane-associated protein n=1 Tax=Steinernema glaseri TaxID=37863 RepID=A0A1I7Z6R0_9BILA
KNKHNNFRKATLDVGEQDQPKRRKSVQFVLDEKGEQGTKKTPEDRPGKLKPFPSILHISPHRIDSLRTCNEELKEPTGAIFLPDHTIIVTDNQIGLILLSMSLDPICKSKDAQWKSAQSPVYIRDRGSVMVSLLYKEKDSVEYQRYLAEFDINFLAIRKRILGPKWVADYPNARDRVSVAANGFIYLTVSDAAFSGLYELAPNGTWTELIHRYDHSFIDVQVLAIVGPITQLLVIEEKRGYVWHVSVRESRVVDRKLLAMVERPGGLAVDQRGNLFVYDKSLGKVARIDTGDPLYRHLEDVALVQRPACHIAANFGILTVVEKLGKTVHLHRYWSMK